MALRGADCCVPQTATNEYRIQVEESNCEFRGAMNDQIPLLNDESQEAYDQDTGV